MPRRGSNPSRPVHAATNVLGAGLFLASLIHLGWEGGVVGERRHEPAGRELGQVVGEVAEVEGGVIPAARQHDEAVLLLEQQRRGERRRAHEHLLAGRDAGTVAHRLQRGEPGEQGPADLGGPGELVTPETGIKIAARSPSS